MIISVHIPKTAGVSFLDDLRHAYGERVFADYGDWPELRTPDGRGHNERRRAAMLAASGEFASRYDVIHGHFAARKYVDVFTETALVTFVRDPYQHAVSTYEHAVRDEAGSHPGHRAFKEGHMTIVDLVEAYPNHQ